MIAALLVGLDALSAGDDPWRAVKAWRKLRERVGAVQRDPTRDYEYDSYPDRASPPRVQPWLLVFDDDGNFTGEAELVDTDGLSVREFLHGLQRDGGPHGRFWLANRVVQGHARLTARIGLYPGQPDED
jgi:hypothetical protein